MADLSIYELQEAILGALEEHENNISRSGNASLEIQKEVNSNIKKIIHSLNQSEKKRTAENKELAKRIETAIKASNSSTNNSSNNAESEFFRNMDNKFTRALSSITSTFKKYSGQIFSGINQAIGSSRAATELVAKTLRNIDASGINQSYEGLRDSIRGSVISLEQISSVSKQISQSFAILGKQSGNAAKTFSELATNASQYAINNNIAMTSDEIAKYTAEYIESQRKMGGLDRLNQKQQQEGVNSLIKNIEELSKTFGVSREKAESQGTQINRNLKTYLYATGRGEKYGELEETFKYLRANGFDEEVITSLQSMIYNHGTIEDSKLAKLMAESGALDALMSGEWGAAFRGGNIDEIIRLLKSPEAWQNVDADIIRNQRMVGDNIGTVQSVVNGGWALGVNMSAAIRSMGKNPEKKEDEALVNEQKVVNAQQKAANEKIFIMSQNLQSYEAYLKTMATATEGIYHILSAGGDAKNFVGDKVPFLSNLSGFVQGIAELGVTAFGISQAYRFGKKMIGGIGKTGRGIGKAAGKVIDKFGKGGAKTTAKTASKTASKVTTKASEKAIAKTAGKSLVKGAGKTVAKKVPFGVGTVASLGFAGSRLAEGDVLGAVGEIASGIASIVPIFGTAVSLGIDGVLMARDIKKASEEEKQLETSDNTMTNDLSEESKQEQIKSAEDSISELKSQTRLLESLLDTQNNTNMLLSKGLINNM